MTNSFETEIILKEESLKYVLEYTCLGRLMSFRDSSRKEIRKRTGMAWKNVRVWGIYWLKNSKNKERRHGFLCISRPILGRRSMVTLGEGTEDAPNLSAEGGTENVAWSDRVTNAEIRKRNNTKNMVAVADSLEWKWGGHVAAGHALHQCGASE
jgi:hypothetical protein